MAKTIGEAVKGTKPGSKEREKIFRKLAEKGRKELERKEKAGEIKDTKVSTIITDKSGNSRTIDVQNRRASSSSRRELTLTDQRKRERAIEAERKRKEEEERKKQEELNKKKEKLLARAEQRKKQNERNPLLVNRLNFSEDAKLLSKFNTRQTLTRQERAKVEQIIKKKDKKITQEQKRLLKNAPKDVATGLFEVGKEIVSIPIDAVKGSFNYGKTLRKRFDQGESFPLKNDILKLAKGTSNVANFVKDNPSGAAAIVGLAASKGLSTTGEAFVQNPIKTTTKAAAYLFPGTIIKGGVGAVSKSSKVIKNANVANRARNLAKKTEGATKVLSNSQQKRLAKKVTNTASKGSKAEREREIKNFVVKLARENGVQISSKRSRSLSLDEALRLLENKGKGKVKIKSVGKKKRPGAQKVPEIQVKGKKATGIKKKTKAEILREEKAKSSRKKRDTTKFFDEKGKRITKREFNKRQNEAKKKGETVKFFDEKGKRITKKKFEEFQKRNKKKPGRPKKDDKSVKFIDLSELDKASSSRKSSLIGNKKAQARLTLEYKRELRTTKSPANSIKKSKIKTTKQKAEAKRKLRNIKSKLEKLLDKVRKNPRVFTGSTALINSTKKAISLIDTKIDEIERLPDKPQPNDQKKDSPQEKAPGKGSGQKPRRASKNKKASPQIKKLVQKAKKKIKVPRKNTPVKAKKPRKIPLRTKTKKKLSSSKTNKAYNIQIKTGKNKFVTLKTKLPKNKALKAGAKAVDSSRKYGKNASFQIVEKGRTKKKDIKKPNVLSKFRPRKGKDKKVRRYVEKNKFRFDSKNERKRKKK